MKHNSQIHAYRNIYKIHSRFIFFKQKNNSISGSSLYDGEF